MAKKPDLWSIQKSGKAPLPPVDSTVVLAQIDELVSKLALAEVNLSTLRTNVGILLHKVSQGRLWESRGHKTFGEYMESIETKFNISRNSCYTYMGLAKDLLPDIGEKMLGEMGLEKAKLVRQSKNETGVLPSMKILEAATQPEITVSAFKTMLLDGRPAPLEAESGAWHSFEYFGSPELQKTFLDALNAAWRTDPVDQPTLSSAVRNGRGLEKLAMEFLSSHSGDGQ